MSELWILIFGTVGAAGVGGTLYHLKRIWGTPDDVKECRDEIVYVRDKVDAIYDHLIGLNQRKWYDRFTPGSGSDQG